jgi:cytochrome P450
MRADMKSQIKRDFQDLSAQDWIKIILEDELLSTCSYLSYVVNEVLRIDPSFRMSTIHEIAGDCQIGPYKFLDGQRFNVYIYGLQNNPSQWIAPERFIPERFDSSSKYFLTPDGKRRHPMSYGPFLGGKRVCLGKTFAESIGKAIVSVLFAQLDFEFVDP